MYAKVCLEDSSAQVVTSSILKYLWLGDQDLLCAINLIYTSVAEPVLHFHLAEMTLAVAAPGTRHTALLPLSGFTSHASPRLVQGWCQSIASTRHCTTGATGLARKGQRQKFPNDHQV